MSRLSVALSVAVVSGYELMRSEKSLEVAVLEEKEKGLAPRIKSSLVLCTVSYNISHMYKE